MKKGLFAVCLLLAFVLLPAQAFALEELTYWVNDEANVISPDYNAKIVSELEELKQNTSVEMAVATVRSLNGTPIETYSINLAHNVLGEKGKDNGILILVAVDDKQWRIEVGYGIEPYITDAMAGRIGRDVMVPYFMEGNYSQGILAGVIAVKNILEGKQGAELTPENGTNITIDWVQILFMLVVFTIIIVSLIARYKTYKKVKKKEDRIFNAAMFAAIMFGGRRGPGGIGGGLPGGGFGGFGGGGFGGGGAGSHW
jgi:uncharacterized protein